MSQDNILPFKPKKKEINLQEYFFDDEDEEVECLYKDVDLLKQQIKQLQRFCHLLKCESTQEVYSELDPAEFYKIKMEIFKEEND
jgi:hypothetical protein